MRSLRGRLTLGTLAVVAAVLAVSGLVVSGEVERSERDALDDRLLRTAELSRETAVAAIEQELPEGDRRLDAVLGATRTELRVLLGETPLLDTGSDLPSPPPGRAGLRTFAADDTRYRTYAVALQDEALGGLARLEVTTRLTALEERLADLDRTLAALGLLALLAAGALAWLAAGVVLRPLRALREAAAGIAGTEDLDRRIAVDRGPRETRALATSFDAMLARLGRSAADRERALEATRRFAADAGHELRTPLTSVRTTLSALRRHPDAPAPQRDALLDDALGEHDRLVGLLDGLQALARGDAPPAQADVDLAEVVDAEVEAAMARHPHIAWSVTLPDDAVRLRGWEPGLRLLTGNLVENAARHGRPRGTVAVTLRGGRAPELRVEDDGPGVPAAERGRIFTPFARATGTEAPGSGLGLALVAQQARHHGARVEVADAELGGASFRVVFPSE